MGPVGPLSTESTHGIPVRSMGLVAPMDESACNPKWVAIGQIQGPFGVKGWVRVLSFMEPYERILAFSEWWLGKDEPILEPDEAHAHDATRTHKKVRIVSGKKHQRGVVAHLHGMATPEQAQTIHGLNMWVPRAQLPEPEEAAHYWVDMVGLQVVTDDGKTLGVVARLFATGANDVLVVHAPDGEERLLPFTEEVIQKVDTATQTITVCLMPGM